jgi:hypothetical protein
VRGDWDVVRHRVAIAGRVFDATSEKPLGDAEVVITNMPPAFKKTLQFAGVQFGDRWAKMPQRPDRTQSRQDGLFYFLDLPDGSYGLRAAIPSRGRRCGVVETETKVSRDADGNLKIEFLRLMLPSTLVKGKVTAADQPAGVALARVRVKGSGERAFTDAQGQYVITGIECARGTQPDKPVKRTLLVSAQGYRTESKDFTLEEPGKAQTVDIPMRRENG